jgi:zinc protease
MQPGYHEADLITEVLSGGQSSRLYQQLVKEKQLCTSIDCYHMGSVEQGIIIIDAKIDAKTTIEIVDAEIEKLLETFLKDGLDANEIEKAKNKTESLIAFEDLSLVNRANNLAFYELLGDANLMNKEIEQYKEVTANSMMTYANKVFDKNNCSTMYYNAIQKSTVS